MTVQEVIDYFGSKNKIAKALNVRPSCISNWIAREKVPKLAQIKLHFVTQGDLKADDDIFKMY
jgi:hypothetical protein